jgi:hypothetical protein
LNLKARIRVKMIKRNWHVGWRDGYVYSRKPLAKQQAYAKIGRIPAGILKVKLILLIMTDRDVSVIVRMVCTMIR